MEDSHPAHADGASAVTTEAKPLQTKSLADVADEPDQEQTGPSDEISDVQLYSLSLTDPDDSSIDLVKSGDTPYTSAKRFSDLNLSPELLECLDIEMKFERPSKIQAISLPTILTPPYKNLIAQAHNGSGKTTCFVLGMLSRVDRECKAPQALCICPTRELAIQNMEVLLKMGKYMEITSELAIPADSSNYVPVHKMPLITAQVIIGTPGTINKWIIAKILGMSRMKILVFDEADHMLSESGFQDVTVKIMKAIVKCNSNCQVLLFSATFDGAVRAFVSKIVEKLFVGDYKHIVVKKEELSLDSVKQYKVQCPDEHSKIEVIKGKIFEIGDKVGQSIIFVRSRDCAKNLHKALVKLGYEVTTIHGALKQEDRDTIIKEFKQGLTQVLISTDLLARGFDQRQVNMVVNFDLPVRYDKPWEPDYEVYLHRVGRAGRFGREGAVFNLLLDVDRDITIMDKIEKHFNVQIPQLGSWKSDKDFKDALKKAGGSFDALKKNLHGSQVSSSVAWHFKLS
ncbi:DEAD-box ATP-dependent RNA helicase 38 [Forsythia ovata]|uniref:RNA helicase n=1 Tax=Forsythia ovata TaxID=205694 RepID=A0ABD1WUY1_9LAMI